MLSHYPLPQQRLEYLLMSERIQVYKLRDRRRVFQIKIVDEIQVQAILTTVSVLSFDSPL